MHEFTDDRRKMTTTRGQVANVHGPCNEGIRGS
jgi:hypothetical protein